MVRAGIAAVCALTAALAIVPAGAQEWGFGVEVGRPLYGEPPVDAYGGSNQPYLYEAPGSYDDDPFYDDLPLPAARGRILHMEAPEIVLDSLDAEGYRELSPMARRGGLYKLTAVEPGGDLVALEISIFTGDIEREIVLEESRSKPRPRVAAAPRPAPRAAAPRPAPAIAAPRAPAAIPAAKAAAAPTAAAPARSPAAAPVPLRDRLKVPPAEAKAGATGDPLVVY